ncbi:MAG: TrbI/VirB10 family protein [Arcobacteraceae bacterium]|jgi:type IV secretory pathway VirB10-like protein|nr:TrbI/VirB10 family protein [Arcobacteraceae bacterium]
MRKETLKQIAKVALFIVVFFSIVFTVVIYSDTENTEETDINKLIIDSKFPLSSYLFNEEKKDNAVTLYEVKEEAPKQEPNTNFFQKAEQLKEQLKAKTQSYSQDIFESDNKIQAELEQQKRERLNLLRIQQGLKVQEPEQNNFINPQKEVKKDFGDKEFTSAMKKDQATSETKLYRAITADKKISAQLLEAIDSTLEGEVTAQIEDDIYASMGTALLIPKGSKAIGEYKSDVKAGENRFAVVWKRIITPYGHNINLTASLTQDLAGNSGVVGEVDDRYWQRYGLPLTLSTLTNGTLLAIAQAGNNNEDSDTQIILDNSRQDLSYIMKRIIDEQIKIKPKITVAAGERIFIKSKFDMWFPEPKNGEIQVKYFTNLK